MFKAWKKKKILKKYLQKLPVDLAKRYGAKEYYSIGQLETTLNDLKYPNSYREYTFVLFQREEDAQEYLGDRELVKRLIKEIAELFFNGDTSFKVQLAKQRAVGNIGHCSIGVGASD